MDLLTELTKLNWPAIAQGVGALWIATVATLALSSWKQQQKAQRVGDFLDQLLDAVHEYILMMSTPIQFKRNIDIAVNSHIPPGGNSVVPEVPGAVEYISRHGPEDAAKLFEVLNKARETIARIQSLVAKGQVFGLLDYEACRDSCNLLIWQHQRLEVFASVIGSAQLNWEHPTVRKSLQDWIPLETEDIERYLQEQNMVLLHFAQKNYERMY